MAGSVEEITSLTQRLRNAGIAYRLDHFRDDAVAVVVAAPGERWEIEFLADGTLDVEVFTSDGTIHGAEKLADLFARFSDD